MRNDEVHQGLEDKEIRDLLAEQFLALARQHVTIRKIVTEYGWQFYNISDEYADYDPGYCLDFVGTAEEHAIRFGPEAEDA